MTGTDHHIAGLGNLLEWVNRSGQNGPKGGKLDTAPQRGMPGYEGYLNERVVTLPELLKDSGYNTMMSGKWHLGLKPEQSPHARGFEKSFALLPACANHYAYEPQLEQPDQTPGFLTMSTIALHSEDGKYVQKLPDGWYSSDGYGDKMLSYLEQRHDSQDDRPFLAYYPFTAPHWPLQAPQRLIKKYKGVYDDGPEALRQKRLQKLKDLGMIAQDVVPHPVVDDDIKPWDDLTDLERQKSCRAMEVFAAMVESIDENVGKVVDYLEKIGELDNTMVCFMSDNGAEGAAYEAYPMVQSGMMGHLQKYYDNSLDNLGNGNSFIWYGPRWAQAATAPSRLYKAYTTEGGVRVPLVARFPKNMPLPADSPLISKTGITDQFATVMDLAPTLLSMAGVEHPAPSYNGRDVIKMRGASWVPFLTGASDRIHPKDFINGWETCGRAAVRKGDWKAVFIPKPKGPERWQLYNLASDPGEVSDLSQLPEQEGRMKELMACWEQYVLETGVVPLAPEMGKWLEATQEQMAEDVWIGYRYWEEGAREEGKREQFFRQPPRFTVKPM